GGFVLWQYYMNARPFNWSDLLQPLAAVLLVLLILHVVIALLLPLRWLAIRGEFADQLRQRLQEELEMFYNQIPTDVVQEVLTERRQVETFLGEIHEVTDWLEKREQAASITNLYGR